MKYALLTLLFIFALGQSTYGQTCYVTVTPEDTLICPGDTVDITAVANLIPTGQAFNFNGGVLPTGWTAVGGSTFSTPCTPSLTGDPYYWASTATAGTYPGITTAEFDVSCGGAIVFDMVFAVQGGAAPCEGPDLADEGVELQYSVGGAPWVPIVYYSPGGYELPTNPNTSGSVATTAGTAYTTWNTFTVNIPPAAMTTNTAFRWTQQTNSGTCCDNWGLENIIINSSGTPCGTNTVVDWNNGLTDTNSFYVTPMVNDTLIAYVYDTTGVFQCESEPIIITIQPNDMTYDLVDTIFAYCPNDSFPAEVLNIQDGTPSYTTEWSTGGTNPLEMLSSGPDKQGEIVYYVDVADACGYTYTDSVVMVTNQTLMIDTIYSFPTSACDNDGAVSAFVSGITDDINQPFYNWIGPGQGGAISIDGTATPEILSSGWYYFSVTDDVCSETDSAFVNIENPPIAEFSANTTQGCDPLEVTFTNTSQNTNSYYWDFDNGNTQTVNNTDSQTQTFANTSTVMLVAYADPTCSDTAYVTINVSPCGCTNPQATNYNPDATIDDGSCILPVPTVVVPNVMTPNGDELNDIFMLTVTNSTSVELTILNRWGNIMFNAVGENPGWDGKTPNGNDAEGGTYFYRYVVHGVTEESKLEGQGFLQLIRQ
ncbi:MAG: gliding motility-associated C-terminal domain-containing protein [Crocinitomicaceae bacterium]|nr:gliding motility-associated C-terminal domain-containing protein [Crocinitomicaceae bacterium]